MKSFHNASIFMTIVHNVIVKKVDESLRENIFKNLNTLVRSTSKTITQISSEVGLSQSGLSHILAKRTFPTLVTLIKLCSVLDCNYEDILGPIPKSN